MDTLQIFFNCVLQLLKREFTIFDITLTLFDVACWSMIASIIIYFIRRVYYE